MRADGGLRVDERISEEDMQHLHAFPHERKATLMERIAAHEANKAVRLVGRDHFERTLARLRRDGFVLVDVQRQAHAFSSVWFRKSEGVQGRRRAEAIIVTSEELDEGPVTTVLTWWL